MLVSFNNYDSIYAGWWELHCLLSWLLDVKRTLHSLCYLIWLHTERAEFKFWITYSAQGCHILRYDVLLDWLSPTSSKRLWYKTYFKSKVDTIMRMLELTENIRVRIIVTTIAVYFGYISSETQSASFAKLRKEKPNQHNILKKFWPWLSALQEQVGNVYSVKHLFCLYWWRWWTFSTAFTMWGIFLSENIFWGQTVSAGSQKTYYKEAFQKYFPRSKINPLRYYDFRP